MMALEKRGYFWWEDEALSDDVIPADTVTGLLKISEDGTIDVELDSILPSDEHPMADMLGERDYTGKHIRGILKDSSTFVLLRDLHRSGGQWRSHGISYQHFRASQCLVGDRALTRPSKLSRFCKLEIELAGFERWLWLDSIHVTRTETEFSAQYQRPDDLSFSVEGGTLHVHYELYGPWGPQKTNTADLREVASLIFLPKTDLGLGELRDFHAHLTDLLILLTGSNYPLAWPTLTAEEERSTCTLYFPRAAGGATPPRVGEWWVSFPQIRATFGQLFSNWRSKRDEFRSGCTLYLATRRNMRLYLEHRFMSLVWGIESFHRRKYPNGTASRKLEEKIKRILDGIEQRRDKKWLAKVLKHEQEPKLEARICQLVASLNIGVDQKSLEEFAKGCARARNDLSHFGGQRERGGDYSEFIQNIYRKSQALSHLYHAVLLNEIGMDPPMLRKAMFAGPLSFEIKTALKAAGLVMKEPDPPIGGPI